MEVAGPLGTPLGLAQRKRASPRGEAGTSGFLSVSDSDRRVPNKAEIDVFLELSCFFDDPTDAGNLISGSSAFSKSTLNIWKFTVHILLKPGLENFEH